MPFNRVLRSILNETEKIWNSTELLSEYKMTGGTETNTTRFVQRIKEHLKEQIYCFKSPGLASLIMHKEKASSIMKVVAEKEEDEHADIEKVSKQIKQELKDLPGIGNGYPVLDDNEINNSILPTVHDILLMISPKFQTNKKAVALISSIIAHINLLNTFMNMGLHQHITK